MRLSEFLGFWTLSFVQNSKYKETQGFGMWFCFPHQMGGETPTRLVGWSVGRLVGFGRLVSRLVGRLVGFGRLVGWLVLVGRSFGLVLVGWSVGFGWLLIEVIAFINSVSISNSL
jgi:hypothetical protein